jgi:glycosyltransferase involved in cell wall biosynthesis
MLERVWVFDKLPSASETEFMKLPISVVVITKNEASNIERCLKSVPWASELLVVDSQSTDGTREKAETLGARVLNEAWRGFGPQKAFAAKAARFDWILSLDADEAVSPELSEEIQNRFAHLDPQTGYEIPRQSFHLGRWIRHGGWYPDAQLRLFHRGHSMWNEAVIHEQVICPKRERLKHRLLHSVFRNLSEQIDTNNRYSSLQAEELWARGQRFSLVKLLVKPASKFFECYFLKLGFLDGMPGFVIAVGAAYSVFLRWSKLWEREKCGHF